LAPDQPQRAAGILDDQHRYTQPLERAFPIPVITRDTLVLLGFALVAVLLRLWALGDRPMHHDESLHGVYSWYLMGRAGPEYHYDPMMHGPLQFHMIGMFYSFLGSSPFTARLWSASCGIALVLSPWLIRRQLGRVATYALMTIFCLSPIILYFSRFAREDMQFGLFTFLTVVGLVRCRQGECLPERRDAARIPGHLASPGAAGQRTERGTGRIPEQRAHRARQLERDNR